MTGRHNPFASSPAGAPQLRRGPNAPATPNMYDGNVSNIYGSSTRGLIRRSDENWAQSQELRIKVLGLLPRHWHEDVYNALYRHGNIFRIEIQHPDAFITFLPPPSGIDGSSNIRIGTARCRVQILPLRVYTMPSPVIPEKKYFQFNSLLANSIDFGMTVAEKTMMVMQTAEEHNGVEFKLNLKRKEIAITFPIRIDGKNRIYRFRLPISLLGNIYMILAENTNQCALIIPFNNPPQFFEKTDIKKALQTPDRVWNEWSTFTRVTEIVDKATEARMASQPVMNRREIAIIDIGQWTTYRLCFDAAKVTGAQFRELTEALADHGILINRLSTYKLMSRRLSLLEELLPDERFSNQSQSAPSSAQDFEKIFLTQISLDEPVRYQLDVCLSNGYLKAQNITREFLEQLASMGILAISILEIIAEKQMVYYDPMAIFKIRVKSDCPREIPPYCVLSRTVTVTPTMLHVNTPVPETSNRILRKYSANSDRFLRVKFSDEKTEGRLNYTSDGRFDEPFNRILRAMANGIVVAGRLYVFLAYGNSQFRENGAYFYAPTNFLSAAEIRSQMGTFDHIKTVAKWGARLGQCFSSTRALSYNANIVKIPDITRNNYTFTDGVGKISRFLAQMAAKDLGLQNPFDDPPSLYQFRLAGCKGVLALDPKLMGCEVHIRESQYKFEEKSHGLEIIRASAFATACFNRQLIIVLSTLGVPDKVFKMKQQEMVNYLERAMTEESVALERLQRNIDFNQTTLAMAAMILNGFMDRKDPFMMSLLQLWRAFNIKHLKEKARIVIEQGAFVLGCVDEYQVLLGHFNDPQSSPDATREEKLETLPEIFLQISDSEKKGSYKVITGVCIIARNPSLHPGDLRVVSAVDKPELRHLKNVLVLPSTGDRDLANMCSGGDLDGDDYLVLWDQDFLPEIINEIPMDFTSEKPEELDRPVTVEDVAHFFVAYMKNDSLARIALSHLAQADSSVQGVKNEKCLELARLHSLAVDYPKSGIPAVMDRSLQPRKWPHFMENKHRASEQIYHSKSILGVLFDQVKIVDFEPQYDSPFDDRVLNAYELDDTMLLHAADIKEEYDNAVKRLMAKHAIRTEFEVWSIFVLSHNQSLRDYSFADEFGKTVGAIKHQFRELCLRAAGASTCFDMKRLGPFVAAMYIVTAREMQKALRECQAAKTVGGEQVPVRKKDPENMPLMSFPWLFHSELGAIAAGAFSDGQPAPQQTAAKKPYTVGVLN
ncbi:RdRP-domain-containing protein [Lojkania enalia]|uniref:RNA-dependent RNA polymerase n=1 Tax=Lojkania enalia TaxID=147567 RepID=A0A9P4TRQ7_9PLEO|nr:RdRP-domain-containing protein [Didymosphaeria enalia]